MYGIKGGIEMFEDYAILGGGSRGVEADVFDGEGLTWDRDAGGVLLIYEGQVLGLSGHDGCGECFARYVRRPKQ
jgi:hypothetical protein